METLTREEWSVALAPLWKEYFMTEEEPDIKESDMLPPLLGFLDMLRECRKPEGFLEHYNLSDVTVVTIHCKQLFAMFGDDAYECFVVGYEHYLRSLGLALCMRCEGVLYRYFPDGKYDPPPSCNTCRSKAALLPNRSAAKTVDFQKIKCVYFARRLVTLV
ncbi:unnamed protein product [Aphanomyces euteiches]